ncbi:esterase/lipase family protein [Psychrobacter sp. I-STPA6b]|uniref:esterase/lipase family protein n=1 Tax=Psychrobacter sp. I-STPA6b TaxID=2585718 RepID=UPI0022221489|nr:triacylglycerol lipase [Psychrobacter sp. I-STPA6b]
MKTRTLTTAISMAGAIFALSTSAHASEYYNCSNPTGCQPVSSVTPSSDLNKTQYPVILAHGLAGWTRLFGIIDYWHGIPEALMSNGADVYATKTSSLHDSEYRGEQLLQQVKTITAITGKQKVNLIGHSHGGHDIRYVAAVAPESVASVTSVASPHQGSKMADWVVKTVKEGSAKDGYAPGEFNLGSKAAISFFKMVGNVMDIGSGISTDQLQEQDGWKAVNALTSDYAQTFNTKYPAAMPTHYCGNPPKNYKINGVAYYSFSGVNAFTNPFDPSDYILSLTAIPFDKQDKNDGLVSACSSRLGYVIRDDYTMNHLDSVNQVLGIVAWGRTQPLAIYRQQVNRLKNEGY